MFLFFYYPVHNTAQNPVRGCVHNLTVKFIVSK